MGVSHGTPDEKIHNYDDSIITASRPDTDSLHVQRVRPCEVECHPRSNEHRSEDPYWSVMRNLNMCRSSIDVVCVDGRDKVDSQVVPFPL